MLHLKKFYKKTFKYDLVNKFVYFSNKKLPYIRKIVLNFGCKTSDIKQLISSVLALELIVSQKGILTTIKRSNAFLKVRKGNPVGCKLTLRKDKMHDFLFKIANEIFPKLKNFHGFILVKLLTDNSFSYTLKSTLSFPELEKHYILFNNLTELKVTVVTACLSKNELLLILKTLQLPIKFICRHNSMVECNLAKIEVKSSNLFVCFTYWISGRVV
jgi:large subunit ribosomal protein L5